MTQRITIVGDGSMATVCALLLDGQGAQVTLWGAFPDQVAELIQTRENRRFLPGYPIPKSIRLTADDRSALGGADLIVSAVPTQFMRRVWERLAPVTPAGVPIVSVAKGMEADTMLRPTQIIADVLGGGGQGPGGKGQGEEKGEGRRAKGEERRARSEERGATEGGNSAANQKSEIRNQKSAQLETRNSKPETNSLAALSGPSVADELARGLPATVCAASDDPALALLVQKTFTTHWFRVYTNADLLGVELAGATKNVIAVAAGILDGLRAGVNAKSALLSRGLAEITRLGVALGARAETFYGLAGVGDLATTCFSPTGRNRTCGEMLGRGKKLDDVLKAIPGVVEGVPTTKAVVALAKKHGVEMPISQGLHMVLFEGLDPLEGISRLMSREMKAERVG